MTPTIHHLLEVALLIPFLALSLGLIALIYGIAWNQRFPKGRR